ncbi:MAG: radical SAM protein [Acidobacteria bacterium]|nr:radical SAM protein [Acidobacteriota bacterium]
MDGSRRWERALSGVASGAWHLLQAGNRLVPRTTRHPNWARPLEAGAIGRSVPDLEMPRGTTSLCPKCVRELRDRISAGELGLDSLRRAQPGEIPARILERDGRVVMEKDCPVHGHFEETLSTNPALTRRIERLFPGRDFESFAERLHDHGPSSIRYGRGGVLTIDLTNRCDMMCDPCFMNANQVEYVHELSFDEVKRLIDNALTIRPKRQISIQFSGGEPTLSPIFLDAVAYAREVGYFSVQAATNGIRFAQDADYARTAARAGLRIAYLQFDGVGEEANAHRKVPNLFEVKLRAIENLYQAGIDVVLVVTVVRTINDHQVGRVVKFAIENADKLSFVSFQPVSFTGRDEDIDEERRLRQRYTLSQLVDDVHQQTGVLEPLRDWFPLSAVGTAADLTDLIRGPAAEWGTLKCACHPDCGVATALMVNKHTKAWAPLPRMFDVERFFADAALIARSGRGQFLTKVQSALALLRNYRPALAPDGFRLRDLVKKFDKQSGGALGGKLGAEDNSNRKGDDWLILFIAGMWFQDLWTYDFRRTEMCLIPYATPIGEISFCAYNTGIGWRQIVEGMRHNPTVAEWYREHGRHEVFANPAKQVPLPAADRPAALSVPEDGWLCPRAGQGQETVARPLPRARLARDEVK